MREPDITLTVEVNGATYAVPSAVIPELGPMYGYWPLGIEPAPPDEQRQLVYAAAFDEWERRLADGTDPGPADRHDEMAAEAAEHRGWR